MDQVPVIAAVLKTSPVAVPLDFGGRVVQQKVNVTAAMFLDVTPESGVLGLIVAGIRVTLARPAALLPIRNLAALDRNCGAVPPHHSREPLANRNGGGPGAEILYAHHRSSPTSALVEANIFSPSLTLS